MNKPYILIDETKTDMFTKYFEDEETAVKTGEDEFSRLTKTDKKKRVSFYVLKLVNPDPEADNHLDGDPVRTWMKDGKETTRETWYIFDSAGNISNEGEGVIDKQEAIEGFKGRYTEQEAVEFGFTLCRVEEDSQSWYECLEELTPDDIY